MNFLVTCTGTTTSCDSCVIGTYKSGVSCPLCYKNCYECRFEKACDVCINGFEIYPI